MNRLLARPVLSNGGNGIKYNVEVEKDGETLMIGKTVNTIFCKYLEFETQKDAINYINEEPRLQLDIQYDKETTTDWLKWDSEKMEEWGKIFCPMLNKEVMTYYAKGYPPFDTVTAPFIDDKDVCYYRYGEGGWYDEIFIFCSKEEWDKPQKHVCI